MGGLACICGPYVLMRCMYAHAESFPAVSVAAGCPVQSERHAHRPVVGRFAPSPTGRMHIGNVYAALAAWLGVRSRNGRMLLRIEDIDGPRVVRDADRWIMDDLHWLGLDWDGEPVYQSQRLDLYESALRRLVDLGMAYPCFCSRADIRAASAPNEGDGFLVYPGTCRCLPPGERDARVAAGVRHSWRVRVPQSADDPRDAVRFDDVVFGPQSFSLSRQLGDVVVRRSDGLFAYQLAVTVDDAAMGVTQIVRGRDLLRSTAIQLWIRGLLTDSAVSSGTVSSGMMSQTDAASLPGVASPSGGSELPGGATPLEFVHLPLVDARDGRRMAKRLNSVDMGRMRDEGVSPEEIVGYCAWLLGVIDEPISCLPSDLLPVMDWGRVSADGVQDRVTTRY